MHQLRPDEISVSVIVPAFNMEPFIEHCLGSLFEQSVDRLEVIVVDDGSIDRTRAVVESLIPPKGKFLKLISKPNGGLSSARNAGMHAARGRWIGFVDADDWVVSTMYSVLQSEAESAGADLAIARVLRVDASGVQEPTHDISRWNEVIASHGRRLNSHDCPDVFLLNQSACGRLYRRAFLERLGFAFMDGVLFEDIPAHFNLLLGAGTVVLVDEALYFYRVGHQGQITGRKDRSLLDILLVFDTVINDLWKHSANAEIWANFIFFQSWVMVWLCTQISDAHKETLISGFARMALKFPSRGIIQFHEKFRHDAQASIAVDLQLYGDADLFAECVRIANASERAKEVANSGMLRRFFIARAQLTSRLARITTQRKWRRNIVNAR